MGPYRFAHLKVGISCVVLIYYIIYYNNIAHVVTNKLLEIMAGFRLNFAQWHVLNGRKTYYNTFHRIQHPESFKIRYGIFTCA